MDELVETAFLVILPISSKEQYEEVLDKLGDFAADYNGTVGVTDWVQPSEQYTWGKAMDQFKDDRA